MRLGDLFSACAVLISVAAFFFTIKQQADVAAFRDDRLYYGSYRIGRILEEIRFNAKSQSEMSDQLQKRVVPIEESLGIDTRSDKMNLSELKNDPCGPDPPTDIYFDATEAKFDNAKVEDALEVGQLVGILDYAAEKNESYVNAWWKTDAGELDSKLEEAQLDAACGALPTTPPAFAAAGGLLTHMQGCIRDEWLDATPNLVTTVKQFISSLAVRGRSPASDSTTDRC